MPETVTELLDVGEKASVPFLITVADAGAVTDSKRRNSSDSAWH